MLRAGICRFIIKNIDILYIFIFGIIAHFLAIEEVIKAFIALPSLLIVSYRFCDSLLIISKISFKNSFHFEIKFDPISRFILLWSFGTVLIVLLAMFLNFLGMFTMQYFVAIILTIVILGIILDTIHNKRSFIKDRTLKTSFKNCLILLVLTVTSILLISYFMLPHTRFPSPMGGIDTFGHLSYVSQITEDNYLNPVPPWISTYPPTLHILFATACSLFNVNPLSLFWTTPFLLYPLFSVGIYLISYQLSKRPVLSLLAAGIGVFATGYPEKVFVANLFYVIPKNIIYLLFPFFLFLIEKNVARAQLQGARHSRIPRKNARPLRNPVIPISKPSNTSKHFSSRVRAFSVPYTTKANLSSARSVYKGDLKNDFINLMLGIANSLLIYSILSLSLSQAIHRLPLIYIIVLITFCLFFTVKQVPTYFFFLAHLVFLFSMIGMFFVLSPKEMFPYQAIYLGILIVTLNMLLVTLLRHRAIPKDFLVFSIITFTSLFVHMPMGLLLICIMFLYLFGKICVSNSLSILLAPIIILAPLLVILQLENVISLDWINNIFSIILVRDYSSGVLYGFSTGYAVLNNSFSSLVLMLTLVGSIAIIILDKTKFLHALSTFCVLIFLYFLPVPGSYRSITYMTPFVSYFSAYALTSPSWLIEKINVKFTRINNRLSWNSLKKPAIFGYIGILVVILPPNIIQPHVRSLQYINSWSSYSWSPSILGYSDIQASMWIKNNTPKDVILISEPNTRVIFSSLANREETFNMIAVHSQIRKILETTDASKAYDIILNLRQRVLRKDEALSTSGARFLEGNRPVIIVINGRTSKMILTPNATHGPAHPYLFEPFAGFNKFYNTTYFISLYEAHEEYENIYIFGVKIDGTVYSG